jgi:hypothetical protein
MMTTTHQGAGHPARKPRKRIAVGPPRPQYLETRDLDRLTIMMVALMGEVSTMRDRMDTCETLAAQGTPATPAAIESFALTPEIVAARAARREAMMKRVFRVLLDEIDTLPEALTS